MTRSLAHLCLALAMFAASLATEAAGEHSRWTGGPALPAGYFAAAVGGPDGSAVVTWAEGRPSLRSFDGGSTWTAFNVPAGGRLEDFSISPTDPLTWYATAGRVIFRTRDGGNTWEQRSSGVARNIAPVAGPDADVLYLRVFRPADCSFLCSGSTATVLTSTDGGLSWVDRNPEMQVIKLAVSPTDAATAYSLGFAMGRHVLRRTTDHARSWTIVDLPPPPAGFSPATLAYGEIEIDRHDANIVYMRPEQQISALAEHIYVTRDGGATWTTVVQPQGTLAPDPLVARRVYLFSYDGRVLESRDAGATWVLLDDRGGDSVSHAKVTTRDGRRHAIRTQEHLPLDDAPLYLGSDLWWNSSESGRGLTITRHSSGEVFVVWFAYDSVGAPVWRVIPGGTWDDRTFSGEMFETTGPGYFDGTFDPARVVPRSVGHGTITFSDEGSGVFSWQLTDGTSGETPIGRQRFGPAPAPNTPSYADLWWNAAESGWGVAINHQGDRIFAAWYVYDGDGKPLWIVMPDATLGFEFVGAIAKPATSGDIYTTRGPPSTGPFDPAAVIATKVGTAKLVFTDPQRAALTYTAFGRTETRAITRQPF